MNYLSQSFFLSLIAFLPFGAAANICSRSPAMVQKIEEIVGKNCSHISSSDLHQVVELTFQGRSESLRSGDLDGLSKLSKLVLSETETELSQLSLADLGALEVFASKPADASQTLLKADFFRYNKKLRMIRMEWAGVLEDGIFSDLPLLEVIYVSAHLNDLSSRALENTNNLVHFTSAYGNGVRHIHPNVFRGKSRLKSLSTSYVGPFTESFLKDSPHLESLLLHNTDNGGWGDRWEMPEVVFRRLKKLMTLWLSGFLNVSLSADVFGGMKDLEEFSLGRSTVKEIDRNFTVGKRLRQFAVSGFEDIELPKDFFAGQSLLSDISLKVFDDRKLIVPDFAFAAVPLEARIELFRIHADDALRIKHQHPNHSNVLLYCINGQTSGPACSLEEN